jgi:hypothetical protein
MLLLMGKVVFSLASVVELCWIQSDHPLLTSVLALTSPCSQPMFYLVIYGSGVMPGRRRVVLELRPLWFDVSWDDPRAL